MTPIDSPRAQALAALYHRHYTWLVMRLRRRLGHEADAADLAQDAFLRLMSIDLAPVLQAPRPYLSVVADRLIVSRHRRLILERAYFDTLATHTEQHAPSAEARLLLLETLEALCRLLAGFPPRTRRIFLLAQLDGLSYPSIAAKLGLHLSTVKREMSRALMQCYQAAYER